MIEDILQDKRFANNPFLREHGTRFYAGAPLRTHAGYAIGSLCVIDTKPRTISAHERMLLQVIADDVMIEIEKRRAASGMVQPADKPSRSVSTPAP